ncbi:hypothetical protein M405DRAFT_805829 [Rhizopogon salebrosus TDB-379]|nr:hypothetical protein M405DRAFT_805829 [Rhizopogon salebrosus TDB-379]
MIPFSTTHRPSLDIATDVHPTHEHLAPSQSAFPPAYPTAESSSSNIRLPSTK